MNTPFSFTKNEQEIMELLWKKNCALSRSEILKFCQNRSWKAGSIHLLLNNLLGKGAIEVDGYVKTGKHYGRTFAAAITKEDYQVMQFKQSTTYLECKNTAITSFLSALCQDEEFDAETLDELEFILQAQRSKLK